MPSSSRADLASARQSEVLVGQKRSRRYAAEPFPVAGLKTTGSSCVTDGEDALRGIDARESNKSSIRIANALHRVGLTTILISIIDNINDFIVDSRHLAKHEWLSSFDRIAPYSLWIGVVLVFAGIVVRDRNRAKPPD
jgi:hypothetical protein